eukprot:494923-Hanusia_phi.AAC.4
MLQQFNSHMAGKLLVQIDEITREDTKKYEEHLKNIVTADTIAVEEKYMPRREVKNYTNLVLTSNHEVPITIAADDRRYIILPCSDVKKMEPGYGYRIFHHWNDDDVAKDISAVAIFHKAQRPIVPEYLNALCDALPLTQKWLCWMCVKSEKDPKSATNPGSDRSYYWTAGNIQASIKEFVKEEIVGQHEAERGSAEMKVIKNCMDELQKEKAVTTVKHSGSLQYKICWETIKSQLKGKTQLFQHLMDTYRRY